MPIGFCQRSWGAPQFLAIIGIVLLAACVDPLVGRVESAAVTTGALTIHTAYALPPFTDAPMPIYLAIDNTAAEPDSLLAPHPWYPTTPCCMAGGWRGCTRW